MANMKGMLRCNTSFKVADINNLFNEVVQQITAHDWSNAIHHVLDHNYWNSICDIEIYQMHTNSHKTWEDSDTKSKGGGRDRGRESDVFGREQNCSESDVIWQGAKIVYNQYM